MEEKNINRNRLETDLLRISGVYESTLARIKKESEEEENTSGNNIKPYKISIFKRILMFFQGRKEEIDEKRNEVIEKILGYFPENLVLLSPFTADYGKNIKLGKNVFVNINNYFMDGATIEIGDHVFIGPSCGFYTANHPLDYTNRNQGLEKALPIKVGDNCWFGANVSVMPGVTIGSGCVIAAGAVVTKDMPGNSLIAGIPAKVIKTIEQ